MREEILYYFKDQLSLQLTLFESTVERENFRFEVQEVGGAGKYSRVRELLDERLEDGVAIVYCATRRNCEQLAPCVRIDVASCRRVVCEEGAY